MEFHFVPNVRKQGPRIIIHCAAENFGVGKLDESPARMIRAQMAPADFPQSRIEIADVDDISASFVDLDAIAHSIRMPRQNVNPANEARNRSLQREAENQRD